MISLSPSAGPGTGREQAGRGERLSWLWLSSRADSWGQRVLEKLQEGRGEGALGKQCRAVVRDMGTEARLPAFVLRVSIAG